MILKLILTLIVLVLMMTTLPLTLVVWDSYRNFMDELKGNDDRRMRWRK